MDAAAALSPAQLDQLRVLQRAGAVDWDTAIGPYDPAWSASGVSCNPGVLSKLWTKGLTKSRVVRTGAKGNLGGQYTAYFLAPEGAARARQLLAEGDAR